MPCMNFHKFCWFWSFLNFFMEPLHWWFERTFAGTLAWSSPWQIQDVLQAFSFASTYLANLERPAGADWSQGWSSFSRYQESLLLCHLAADLALHLNLWCERTMHRVLCPLISQEKICTNSHFSLCLKVSISSLRLLWRQLLIVSNWQPPRSTKPYQVLMAVYQCIGQTGPSMVCIRVSQTKALQNQNQAPLFQDESHKVLSCWTIYLNQRWKK